MAGLDVWMRSTTYNDSKTKRINLGSNSKGEVVIFPLLDGMRMDGIIGPRCTSLLV